MANEYATAVELKSTLELSGESFADADVTLALTAASRALDNLCERRFYKDADATQVRYYSPQAAVSLRIDDLVTFTALASDDDGDGTFETTWVLNTDFVLEPLNATADNWPWTTIRVRSSGSRWLPDDERSVRLTGQFGWVAVPEAIKEATLVLASRLLRRAREAPFGVIAAGLDAAAAIHIARFDPDVKLLTGSYMRDLVIA